MAKGKTDAQRAAEQANQALAPQEQLLADLQSQAQQRQQAEIASALGYTNAEANQAQAFGPAVSGIYNQAANTQGALAKGYSDGFRMAENNQAGDINGFLAQQGAPSGQMLPGDTGAADVMFGLGGSLPGQTFSREGAAFGAAAANYPNMVMGVGRQQISQINKNYADLQQQYASELKAIKAQYPQLYNQALAQLQQAAQQQAELQFKQQLAAKEFGLDVYKAKNQASYQQGSLKLRGQSQNSLNAYRLASLELKQYGLDISAAKLRRQLSNSGLTPSQYLKRQGDAYDTAKDAFSGVPQVDKKTGAQVGWESAPMSYQALLRLLRGHGYSRAEARGAANQFYKPGSRGRPRKKVRITQQNRKQIVEDIGSIG